MRCERCPAIRTEGYEYPETYCSVGVPDNECDENAKGEIGCTLHPKTIEKRLRDNDRAWDSWLEEN